MPPFSLNPDIMNIEFPTQNKNSTSSYFQVSNHVKDAKCFSFYHKNDWLLCFYYEMGSRTNRLEILKSTKSSGISVLCSKQVDRGFLDPVLIKYCPRMALFCCLESIVTDCHRGKHQLVLYHFSSRSMRRLSTITPFFSEIFENFELVSSLRACVTTSRNMISVWSLNSKKRGVQVKAPEIILCLKYLPSVNLLICGGRQKIFAYRIRSQNEIDLVYQLREHYESISDLCWDPISSSLVSRHYDSKILVWKLSQDKGSLSREVTCKTKSYFDGLYLFVKNSVMLTMDRHHIYLFSFETGLQRKVVHNIGKLIGYDVKSQRVIIWSGSDISLHPVFLEDNANLEPPLN